MLALFGEYVIISYQRSARGAARKRKDMSNENTDIITWYRGDSYPANWPQWLRDADIEWCEVEISESGRVCWLSGEWHNGEWHGDVWHRGVWHDGVWRGGSWYGGIWYYGGWYGGVWHDGTWLAGKWHDGKSWRSDGPPGSVA